MGNYLVSSRDWQNDYYVVNTDTMKFSVVHKDDVPMDAKSYGYIGKANISKKSSSYILLRVDTVDEKVIYFLFTKSDTFKLDFGHKSDRSTYYVYPYEGKTDKYLIIGQSYVEPHKYIPFRVQEMRKEVVYKWLPDKQTFELYSSMSDFKPESKVDFDKL